MTKLAFPCNSLADQVNLSQNQKRENEDYSFGGCGENMIFSVQKDQRNNAPLRLPVCTNKQKPIGRLTGDDNLCTVSENGSADVLVVQSGLEDVSRDGIGREGLDVEAALTGNTNLKQT